MSRFDLRQSKIMKEKSSKKRTVRGAERQFTMEEDFSTIVDDEPEDKYEDLCMFCAFNLAGNERDTRSFNDIMCCKFCFQEANEIQSGRPPQSIQVVRKNVNGKKLLYFQLCNSELIPINMAK